MKIHAALVQLRGTAILVGDIEANNKAGYVHRQTDGSWKKVGLPADIAHRRGLVGLLDGHTALRSRRRLTRTLPVSAPAPLPVAGERAKVEFGRRPCRGNQNKWCPYRDKSTHSGTRLQALPRRDHALTYDLALPAFQAQ